MIRNFHLQTVLAIDMEKVISIVSMKGVVKHSKNNVRKNVY